LGLGQDGHTASLFPGTNALEETHHNAVLNDVPALTTKRLTVTYPVLNSARAVWFLIAGADKAPMVERLQQQDATIPAGCIQNPATKIYWNA
jgi:6-phosphogluconolactonase